MDDLSKSQRARLAIRTFKVISDALILRGFYKVSGKSGGKLSESLKVFNPELYGSMSDPRVIELKGLQYVMDRMPRGIEKCNRIIFTADEDFSETSFEQITPLKRRRQSYIVSEKEICFVITRGLTEIYDILTNITFLNIESQKIQHQICNKDGGTCAAWQDLETIVKSGEKPEGTALDQAIWNLSIILGRTYRETRDCFESFDVHNQEDQNFNNGIFATIYEMGKRILDENESKDKQLTIYFTPSLQEMIGIHTYATRWAKNVKRFLYENDFPKRDIHVVSANMHSMVNLLYGAGFLAENNIAVPDNLYGMVGAIRELDADIYEYASNYGFTYLKDTSESNIDAMVIDTAELKQSFLHSSILCDFDSLQKERPVIIVIDYAFGAQAFDIMDELLCPCSFNDLETVFNIKSISIMGKAGILSGNKGDIMLATAHVMEGTPNNYIVNNDLSIEDFDEGYPIHEGPMVTVLGTSLQNRDVLQRFHTSNWRAVGLEMEGGHYQRAIGAAIIQGHIPRDIKTRYAYYASDNPLQNGQTLAAGSMGDVGIVPTYMITKVIFQKIINTA
jgi:Family of unknown function (DUF6909)